jgi:hypothetical protein
MIILRLKLKYLVYNIYLKIFTKLKEGQLKLNYNLKRLKYINPIKYKILIKKKKILNKI